MLLDIYGGFLRFVSEQFRVASTSRDVLLVLAFPRYCPEQERSVVRSGFHRYEPVSTQELLPGDAVFSTF